MSTYDEYYCPDCGASLSDQTGFDPENGSWTCTECGREVYGGDVYDGEQFSGVMWYCDECGALLNKQSGFSDYCNTWICGNCGHLSRISEDEIFESKQDYEQNKTSSIWDKDNDEENDSDDEDNSNDDDDDEKDDNESDADDEDFGESEEDGWDGEITYRPVRSDYTSKSLNRCNDRAIDFEYESISLIREQLNLQADADLEVEKEKLDRELLIRRNEYKQRIDKSFFLKRPFMWIEYSDWISQENQKIIKALEISRKKRKEENEHLIAGIVRRRKEKRKERILQIFNLGGKAKK